MSKYIGQMQPFSAYKMGITNETVLNGDSMNAQEFVLMQLEWLQAQYAQAQDSDTRERLITAIEDIVIAALGEGTYSPK